MDGSPDPLVIILGAVALAVVTIAGIFAFTWLFARRIQRMIPSSEETAEILKAAREREPQLSRSYLLLSLFGIVMNALLVAGMILAIKGRQPALVGVVGMGFLLLFPFSFIVSGISVIRNQFVVVNRLFRPNRLLTGADAVRRGWVLIGIGIGLLLVCLGPALAALLSGWLEGSVSWPLAKPTP